MMLRKLACGLFIIALMSVGIGISAQSQSDLLATVTAAIENFAAVSSYQITLETTTAQRFSQNGTQLLAQTITQEGVGSADNSADNIALQMNLDQTTHVEQGAQTVDAVVDMQMVVIDNTLYVLFDNVSASIASVYPQGWVNLTEDPDAFPGAELLNAESLIRQMNSAMLYPLNDETVAEIVELPAEEIDGVATRPFQLTMDVQAIFDSGFDQALGSLLNLSMPGMTEAELLAALGEGMSLQLTLWIGEEDQLPYRIVGDVGITLDLDSAALGAGSGTITMEQQQVTTQTFSAFNEPVEITAPDMET